ncbi:SWI/SNF chromatin-remodeling accessory subunit 2 [Caenorhabditis elegans]|uniref:SWI/SNF chromatin-remodeling accessory subunit 2 n=1 Tax=Caenorhabditis elegans TaxID=6239 RepID=SWIC2_CAEEL|nr:SWI/SNF chromatin-remodeling accessory subunit 2 [Caenorhabditis elegans]O02101.2 RecName: Full=SWI/SNF chromatin-remodeling accessory subunit 2 [Caenorhabditis elegans]CCD65137.1 SWI/SNF chromatin-remodeling accessory subunit 2 [Caenorhabditis elegans]|eukprot:NP_491329.2 SWI/SNF nucleosome remodeling complex component [Caenorhabditis elegans]
MHSQQRPNPQMNRHPYGTPGSAPQMRRPGGFAGQPPQMHGPRMVAPPAAPLPKKKKYADKCIHPKIRELEPDAENYMALLASEQKLDSTLSRKKLDIQEALKRPSKVKKRLRIYISHTFIEEKQPEKDTDEASLPMWELRVEGRLLDEQPPAPAIPGQRPVPKRKFSSFFKSLVIELDKEMYGPDQHLVEWHRTPQTNETDGFQVKRAGDRPVKCRILLLLDNHPAKFKLHPRLAKVLGIATETRPKIIEALWQYIKTHGLQDPQERDIINCDTFLSQCFGVNRMRFMEVPNKLHQLLQQTDPLEFNHIIQRPKEGQEQVSTCYDIDVEMEDPVKQFMHTFVHSPGLANDIQTLDQKCYDIIEQINELKTRRDFYARFYTEPAEFIKSWVMSQNSDLKTMNELSGDLEAERFAESYVRPETEEGVQRYMFQKVNQKRHELEQSLGVRSN